MVKSISSHGDELEMDYGKKQEWTEIMWMVGRSCMFSIAGGSEKFETYFISLNHLFHFVVFTLIFWASSVLPHSMYPSAS